MENQGFNPIELWIKTDEKLSAILTKIEKQAVSLEEQAEMAFHQVAENYNLPKMPPLRKVCNFEPKNCHLK